MDSGQSWREIGKNPLCRDCRRFQICQISDLVHSVDVIGFPDSSAGKESACNVGDPSLIPGLRRSAGEGVGYPLQYSGLENSMN